MFLVLCSVMSVCAGSMGRVWDCMRTVCQTATAATSAETHQVRHQNIPKHLSFAYSSFVIHLSVCVRGQKRIQI